MARIVLLDSGLVGMVTHPRRNADEKVWPRGLPLGGSAVLVPEIVDYEVWREFLRADKMRSVERIDALIATLVFVPITTSAMRLAAAFWASARRQGRPTAPDLALDADVILAGQAVVLAAGGDTVVVATTNVGHLARFIDARHWQDIQP